MTMLLSYQAATAAAWASFNDAMDTECGPATLPIDASVIQAVFSKARTDALALFNAKAIGCVRYLCGAGAIDILCTHVHGCLWRGERGGGHAADVG